MVLTYHFKIFSLDSSIISQSKEQKFNNYRSSESSHQHQQGVSDRLWLSAMYSALLVLLNPNLIFIENGHFQFNSIMLGFALASLTCFYAGRDLLGAFMFVCSLAFKQMALYYSPAIFAYLFGKCLYLGHPNGTKLFIQLAIVSTGTMGLLFGPFIFESDFPQLILQVLQRIFPLGRGLFEDKVGNFWPTLNLIVKIRTLGTVQSLSNVALFFTMGAILPGILIVIISSWKLNPTRSSNLKLSFSTSSDLSTSIPKTIDLLPLALFNSSIVFYLFSFQVHEKSILLPVLPLLLILSRHHKNSERDPSVATPIDWHIICLISNVSIFSMWPLLKRDGLGMQYLVSILSYNHMIGYNLLNLIGRNLISLTILAIHLGMIGIHTSEQFIKPPKHLPDLFVVMNLALSFLVFFVSYVWSLLRIYEEARILNGYGRSINQEPSNYSKEVEEIDLGDRIGHQRSEYSLWRDEAELDEGERFRVKLPTKLKSASLQQHGRRKTKSRSQSESELEELKSICFEASKDQGSQNIRKRMLEDSSRVNRSNSKAMISSPSGAKLMNRIKNRLQLDASKGQQSKSRSRSSQRDTSTTERDCQTKTTGDEEEEPPEEYEFDNLVIVQRVPVDNKDLPVISPSSSTSSDFTLQPPKVESTWEITLRLSREGAVRRRREELLLTRNLKQ